jgi:hypothetical protein
MQLQWFLIRQWASEVIVRLFSIVRHIQSFWSFVWSARFSDTSGIAFGVCFFILIDAQLLGFFLFRAGTAYLNCVILFMIRLYLMREKVAYFLLLVSIQFELFSANFVSILILRNVLKRDSNLKVRLRQRSEWSICWTKIRIN